MRERDSKFIPQVALVLSLAITTLAFTVPFQANSNVDVSARGNTIINLEDIVPIQETVEPEPVLPESKPTVVQRSLPPIEVPNRIEAEVVLPSVNQELDVNQEVAPAPVQISLPEPIEEAISEPVATVFDAVEQMPELQGGIAALQSRIEYPEFARRAGIEGRVFVQFVVEADGVPRDIIVLRGIGGGCDEAAIRAVRESRFTPGLQRGRPVAVRMSLPVVFRLN